MDRELNLQCLIPWWHKYLGTKGSKTGPVDIQLELITKVVHFQKDNTTAILYLSHTWERGTKSYWIWAKRFGNTSWITRLWLLQSTSWVPVVQSTSIDWQIGSLKSPGAHQGRNFFQKHSNRSSNAGEHPN